LTRLIKERHEEKSRRPLTEKKPHGIPLDLPYTPNRTEPEKKIFSSDSQNPEPATKRKGKGKKRSWPCLAKIHGEKSGSRARGVTNQIRESAAASLIASPTTYPPTAVAGGERGGGGNSLVHGLLELLLVEELEDEEDELAAERRHGCGRPFRGRSAEPEGGGAWRLRRPGGRES
jgi:hypothetical protein